MKDINKKLVDTLISVIGEYKEDQVYFYGKYIKQDIDISNENKFKSDIYKRINKIFGTKIKIWKSFKWN